jgi:hypothetical protein
MDPLAGIQGRAALRQPSPGGSPDGGALWAAAVIGRRPIPCKEHGSLTFLTANPCEIFAWIGRRVKNFYFPGLSLQEI